MPITKKGKSKKTKAKSKRINPLKPPRDKWIRATGVKFNRNGTVSVRAVKNPRKKKTRR